MQHKIRFVLGLVAAIALAACGGGGGEASGNYCVSNCTRYVVNVNVSGLVGTGLVLQSNFSFTDLLAVSANGTYPFNTPVNGDTPPPTSLVTVYQQPINPNQTCTVTNGPVSPGAIPVTCAAVTGFRLGVTVAGLTSIGGGPGLVLSRGGENLGITTNGSFTFATPLASGSPYAVTVGTQPAGNQTCLVSNGTGIIATANVLNIAVTCRAGTLYAVSGSVSGLVGSGLVLQNNAGDDLAVSANGSFTFATPLANGSAYVVSVKTQPSSPAQTCTVTAGAGTIILSVSNIAVSCVSNTYAVGGTVTGLAGSGLVLQNNGFNDLVVTANGTFVFATPVAGGLANGAAYAVTVKTQPSSPAQACSVANGSGNIAAANVVNVAITCVTAAGRFAYVANNGSNSISAYTIGANGSLAPIAGSPFAAGTNPYGIAISPSGKYLATNNEGSNTVSVYGINPTTGVLAAVPGSPFAAGTVPEALTFDPTGAYLYVANVGSNNISAYSVSSTTGALTPIGSPVTSGQGPNSIIAEASGKFILVSNFNNGATTGNVSVYSINATTGALTAVPGSPFAGGGSGSFSLAISGSGKFVYVLNGGTGAPGTVNLSGFSLNTTTGALTPLTGFPFSFGSGALGGNYIAADRSGAFLYVPAVTANKVSAFAINATTGALTAVTGSPYATGSNPYSVSVDPSNKFLYVGNDGDGTITGYTVNADTGAMTLIPGSPFAAGTFPDFIGIW